MHREIKALVLWLVTFIASVAILATSGCTWGQRERLAYDAGARAKRNEEALAETKRLSDTISTLLNGIDEQLEPTLYSIVLSLSKPIEKLEQLAASDLGRARIAQLFHGTPPDLTVELGSGKDNGEVVAFAGLAAQQQSKRLWSRDKWKNMGRAVADFAAGMSVGAAAGVREVVTTIVPSWLLWVLAFAIVIAIGIGLYALYQRLVVVKRAKRTVEEKAREIEQKDRAIDEYDDAMEEALEGRDHEERARIGKGEYLKREHFPRNQRRKRAGGPISGPYEELQIDYTPHEKTPEGGVPTNSAMLPGLKTRHSHASAGDAAGEVNDAE